MASVAPAPEPLFELGRGGMGAAYLARATGAEGFERLVVVKRLHAHLATVPTALERFLDEARLAAHVRHANVVGTQHVDRDEQGPYLVLDYVEGSSLDGLVDRLVLRRRPFPLPLALRIGLDALAGLEAVHEATDSSGRHLRMLHRDVTLQNILVGRDGVSRIADFGIAKSALGSVVTDERYLVGKLLYMAPEYIRRGAVDVRLDVYALGVTLWLVLSGRELWAGASEEQLLAHVLGDSLPPISGAGVVVPPQIEALIARACAKQASDRFASARDMAAEIEKIVKETGWLATHAEVAAFVEELCGQDLLARRQQVAALIASPARVGPVHAVETEVPRRRRFAVVFAVALALVLGAVGFLGAQRRHAGSVLEPTAMPPSAPPVASVSDAPAVVEPTPPVSDAAPSVQVARTNPPVRRATPAASSAASPAPRPPEGISTSNPYLK